MPSSEAIPTSEVQLSFTPVPIASFASCPAGIPVSFGGMSVTLSFDWLCSYASTFKPFIITFALLTAALIVIGGPRRDA